jgi:hypothetical protein
MNSIVGDVGKVNISLLICRWPFRKQKPSCEFFGGTPKGDRFII